MILAFFLLLPTFSKADSCAKIFEKTRLLTYQSPPLLAAPFPAGTDSLRTVVRHFERFGNRDYAAKINKLSKIDTSEMGEAILLASRPGHIDELTKALGATDTKQALIDLRAEISTDVAAKASPPPVDEAALLAGREMERVFPAGYRSYRAEDKKVAEVLKRFPLLAQNIEEKSAKLRELKLQKQTSHPVTIKHFRPLKRRAHLATKVSTAERKMIAAVWNRMNDPESAANYIRSLAQDAAVEMAKVDDPRVRDAFQRGELIRNYVLKVLVKRHRAQGNGEFSTIVSRASERPSTKTRKKSNNEDFRAAVGQGPFFDKPFIDARHGVDTHFMQIDYVSAVIWEASGGQPREFWKLLGSKRGIDYWVGLFDNFDPNTLATPEFFSHQVSSLLRITD